MKLRFFSCIAMGGDVLRSRRQEVVCPADDVVIYTFVHHFLDKSDRIYYNCV